MPPFALSGGSHEAFHDRNDVGRRGAGLRVCRLSLAEARSELGKQEYESNCVACHGATGKGDGYFAQYLKLPVPDLTTIQQRNGGVFPADRMIEIIDGRSA